MTPLYASLLFLMLQLAGARTSSISGRVVDSDGKPVPNAAVDALRIDGQDLRLVQRVQTNDRGEYRLFWLGAGSYYVCAIDANGPAILKTWSVTPQGRDQQLPPWAALWGWPFHDRLTLPVYSPSSPDTRNATLIPLAEGQEFLGADVKMLSLPMRRIRGIIKGSPFLIVGPYNDKVELIPRHSLAEGLAVRSVMSVPDRNLISFEFSKVLPGSYDLVWSRPGPPSVEKQVFPIEVTDSDLELRVDFSADAAADRFQVTRVAGSPSNQSRPSFNTRSAAGAISGIVRNREGAAIGAAEVHLLQEQRKAPFGWNLIRTTLTNDRGEYRFFGLPDGNYYVAARPGDVVRGSEIRQAPPPLPLGRPSAEPPPLPLPADENGLLWIPSYYPDTTDPAKARAVSVTAGADVPNVDIMTAPGVAAVTVSGKVVDEKGKPFNAGVRVVSFPDVGSLGRFGETNERTGEFVVRNIPPGAYFLVSERGWTDAGKVGTVSRIDVPKGGLKNVSARVIPTTKVHVQFSIEGVTGQTPQLSPVFDLQSDLISRLDGPPLVTPMIVPLNSSVSTGSQSADIRFVIPGDHWFAVSFEGSSPNRAYLKSARAKTTDLLTRQLHLEVSDSPTINAVIAVDGAIVEGRVTGPRNSYHPQAGLIPDDSRQRGRYQVTPVRFADGSFRFEGVAPGTYSVIAWDSDKLMEDFNWIADYLTHPDILARVRFTTRVVVESNSTQNIQVGLNPELH